MDAEKNFIQVVKAKCKEHNVELLLKNSERIKFSDNMFVGGYFQDISPTQGILACATSHPSYLQLLVHEFSHMEQWIEKSEIWENSKNCGDVDEWIGGKKVRNIANKIDTIKLLELDCEKRAIKNIKKYRLPINTTLYAQKANSYILFYNYLKETRSWSKPGNSPYSEKNKTLWKMCPNHMKPTSYYETIPKKIYKKFVEFDI